MFSPSILANIHWLFSWLVGRSLACNFPLSFCGWSLREFWLFRDNSVEFVLQRRWCPWLRWVAQFSSTFYFRSVVRWGEVKWSVFAGSMSSLSVLLHLCFLQCEEWAVHFQRIALWGGSWSIVRLLALPLLSTLPHLCNVNGRNVFPMTCWYCIWSCTWLVVYCIRGSALWGWHWTIFSKFVSWVVNQLHGGVKWVFAVSIPSLSVLMHFHFVQCKERALHFHQFVSVQCTS